MPYHAVKVGDCGVLIGVRVKKHLRVGVDGYVRLHALLVLTQELGDSFDFWFRFREGAAVGVITRVRGGTLI